MAIKLKLSSGRVVVLRELTAEQQMNADIAAINGDAEGTPQAYYRIAAALQKLGTESFGEFGSDLDLEARIDLFDAAEFNEITAALAMSFAARRIKRNEAGEWALTSGKKVRVHTKQTARQQLNADRCAFLPVCMTYYRVAAIIEAIDGKFTIEVDPSKLKEELDGRLKAISARDYQELQQAYNSGHAPSPADIKNV